MTRGNLLRRNLTYYWRTNLAVVAGVAAAVAVLAGALLVGDSVRASLRELVLLRLGDTSFVLTSSNFFRDELAAGIEKQPEFRASFLNAVPLIALDAVVTHEKSRRRASGVAVYGVDARFWKFHGRDVQPLEGHDVLVSANLADEFGAAPGDALIVRVEKPSAVPVESLHSRKDDLGRTLRLRVRETLPAEKLGEFSLRPQQGAVRAVFVSLEGLQRELHQAGRVNGVLVSEAGAALSTGPEAEARRGRLESLLRSAFQLDDLGVRVVNVPSSAKGADPVLSVESSQIIVGDRVADAALGAAKELGWSATPVFTYLANTIWIGDREIPYSLVTALGGAEFASLPGAGAAQSGGAPPPIWLNDWAWRELNARDGQTVTLDYYVWKESGRLETRSAQFVLRGRVLMGGLGGDRSFAPNYPGISDSLRVGDWDPPFPIDTRRIRPRDEDYWTRFRTAPKAFVALGAGQNLWQTRYGKFTAVRLTAPAGMAMQDAADAARRKLREKLDPVAAGIAVYAARAAGIDASRGAVDFSLYFVSFSFFLVISAALLASLFFRLGIEQRLREIGLLEAFGYSAADIRRLFLSEGLFLAALGSVLGAVGAAAYGALMIYGLRTWWVGAVGTAFLRLEVAPVSLLAGVVGGLLTAVAGIAWTLRGLRSFSPRSLVTGSREAAPAPRAERARTWRWGATAAVLAVALLVAAWLGKIDQAGGFFGAGSLLLAALLTLTWGWLASRKRTAATRTGLAAMGARNAAWRPGRSLLCIALVASATFILVAVDAFRRDTRADSLDPHSGTGGFPLFAESLVPIAYDPNTPAGREQLNLSEKELQSVRFFNFRLRPGEDASCLNLYQPRNPRVLGVPTALIESERFAFSGVADANAPSVDARGNPWRLLGVQFPDGAIPAIVDTNTMTYILQRKLGEDFVLDPEGKAVRLRLVAALKDSIFQSELLISEEHFLRAFPNVPGYRFFLLDAPAGKAPAVSAALEDRLEDFGFDVTPASDRLAVYHRVENTYLSTFQALGGLGLLLGTLGLAAVMLRNVIERRRELALLRAVGYRPADLVALTLAENSVLLLGGLFTGIACAALAILPALLARGGSLGGGSLPLLLGGVALTGFLASVVAVGAALRAPVLAALRSE
jgi:ABC-type lipoprotein release transport system permease subunit